MLFSEWFQLLDNSIEPPESVMSKLMWICMPECEPPKLHSSCLLCVIVLADRRGKDIIQQLHPLLNIFCILQVISRLLGWERGEE